MEMHHIRYFLALSAEQSFTRAAKLCGVAQPSLTRGIKQLETELGGSLFLRGRNSTRLSELGVLLHPRFERIERAVAETMCDAALYIAALAVSDPTPQGLTSSAPVTF
ncbi:MAG: LysR family transcriptional regulator [Rhodopseudomonas sp.]|nr:LysR family transcriptional regulator [Rhodopseudomonas sp.]